MVLKRVTKKKKTGLKRVSNHKTVGDGKKLKKTSLKRVVREEDDSVKKKPVKKKGSKLKKVSKPSNEVASRFNTVKKPKKTKWSIEKGFISKLLECGDMKFLTDTRILPDFFTGENRMVFHFILNTFRETGELPTDRVIHRKFPSYELEEHYNEDGEVCVGTDESFLYWAKELRRKAKHNKMADVLESSADMLTKGDTDDAYSEWKKGLWYIENNIEESSRIDITQDAEQRKSSYLERKKNKGIMGIPCGIAHLDYLLKGFVPGTLTTLIAQTGVGKTWLTILFACYACMQGYKVSFFTTEMSEEILRDRIDAMLFSMTYGELDYMEFKNGDLPPDKEKDYFEFLEDTLPKLEPIIINSANGVSSIVSSIELDKPDIVFIDSFYLMTDENGAKATWERVTNLSRDIKSIAKNFKIPIFINCQADENTSKKTGPNIGDIKYAQSIGQDSDNVLAIHRDELMFADREMCVSVQKQREGMSGKCMINWDFTTMNFSSVYSMLEEEDDDSKDRSADDAYTDVSDYMPD